MITNDLSLAAVLNTLIISTTIAIVGWLLKQAASLLVKLLIDAIKNLIAKLNEAISKVEILDHKVTECIRAVSDHEKLRNDIRVYFDDLKKVKRDVDQLKNQ